MKKIVGYRVFRCLTDVNGKVVHKTPIGCAKNEKGARALMAGCSGLAPMSIEPIYTDE